MRRRMVQRMWMEDMMEDLDLAKMAKEVREILGEDEVLTQLAEEASELAQAALKLRRANTGINPTPKSTKECLEALLEEVADVLLCLQVLGADVKPFVPDFQTMKLARWLSRLDGSEAEK